MSSSAGRLVNVSMGFEEKTDSDLNHKSTENPGMGKSLRWSRKAQSERFRRSPYFTIGTQWALSTAFREFVSAFRVLEESLELFGRKQTNTNKHLQH